MNFSHTFKEYTVFNLNGNWRIYCDDPSFTKEEGIVVLNHLSQLDENRYNEIPSYIENLYLVRKLKKRINDKELLNLLAKMEV